MFARPGLFLFGLTGGVASGKSTVGRIFRDRGVHVIDADDLARRVVLPGEPALAEIAAAFEGVVSGGALDRIALGKVIFADAAARARLNTIVHPRVAGLLQKELDQLPVGAIEVTLACYEVPLLFENSLEQWLRPTVLVACDPEVQIVRAMARNGWTRQHALARIAAQMPLDEKRKRADYVIENTEGLPALEASCDSVLGQLVAVARQKGSVQ